MPQEDLAPRQLGKVRFFARAISPTRAIEYLPEVIEALKPIIDAKIDLRKLFGKEPPTEETILALIGTLGGVAKMLVGGRLLRLGMPMLSESYAVSGGVKHQFISREAIDAAFENDRGQILPAIFIVLGVNYLDFFPAIVQYAGSIRKPSPSEG